MSPSSAAADIVVRDVRLLSDGSVIRGDVAVGRGRVLAVGSDLSVGATAANLEAGGAAVVPLTERAVARHLGARSPELAPGVRATFAVVMRADPPRSLPGTFIVSPRELLAIIVEGEVLVTAGQASRHPGPSTPAETRRVVGDWHDESHDLVQHLRADGRYSETREGRVDAYTGRYWLASDRIVYLDDSGFWALGQWVNGRLFHAHLLLDRQG